MKVAVVGGGGREHAILKKLAQDDPALELFVIPGNGGAAEIAQCVPIEANDIAEVARYCAGQRMDYVVVAPDDPLALGLVDRLAEEGIPAFGPTAAAARIEASKVFAKDLMRRYGIPTAAYQSFTAVGPALAFARRLGNWPVVVKADGLALGKGVVICQNEQEAEAALRGMLENGRFGASGSRVVVEEFLSGPEVSVLAFCDGKTLAPMVSAMDHKRAFDGDAGPNTGGMGCIAPSPLYTASVAARCQKEIFEPTVAAMAAEGAPFKGCLYFGLMLCADGPKVIEYNCRFGDPETQVVLPLMQSPLLPVMRACTDGMLAPELAVFSKGAAASVVLASGGYPGSYQTGYAISGIAGAERLPGVTVYQAGTRLAGGELYTAGGRVLNVTATGKTLDEALGRSYAAVDKIAFDNMHYRCDIGKTVWV